MFTKADIRNGSTYLAVHLSANDYYCEGERVEGRWYGKLARRFGIEGNAIAPDDQAFENLRLNLTPDGYGKLTPGEPGIRFFDFQCSAQKSVSLMAVTLGDDRLREAHTKAFEIAFQELERFAACRMRTGVYALADQNRITGNVCAAVFHHDASRALDPQLHTHAVVANATYDPTTGKTLALTEREMLKAIRYAGKVYQNALATNLRALGYEIESTRKAGRVEGFEIKGVAPELLKRFSKRRAEIETAINEFITQHGREPSAAETHVIATSTRNAKLTEITTADVLSRQRDQLSPIELEQLEELKQNAITRKTNLALGGESRHLRHATNHLFERLSVLPGHQILAEALNQNLGYQSLLRLKQKLHEGSGGLVSLVPSEQNPLLSAEYATIAGLRIENACIRFIGATTNKYTPSRTEFELKLARIGMPELRPDQTEAVRLICTSQAQVSAVRGVAGAGKTYMLKAVAKILDNEQVYYIAPTASAVETLRKDGFENATTCSNFLLNVARQEDLRGAIVICDEAGLQSNKQGYELLKVAAIRDMRVRFVGDSRQHVSVEAGDFLRVMETYSNLATAEVGRIERQRHEQYREAIFCMASSQVRSGLERLDRLSWIIEGKSDYIKQAAAAYLEQTKGGTALDQCIAVCPTWAENHRLTREIRAGLKQVGQLSDGVETTVLHSCQWTDQQKRISQNYERGMVLTFTDAVQGFKKGQSVEVIHYTGASVLVTDGVQQKSLSLQAGARWDVSTPRTIEIAQGDKILIRANDRQAGVINGEVLTVQSISTDGRLETTTGKIVPPQFKQWCHGYVVTSYKAQGATAENVVVAAARLNGKSAYVACSRGRQSCLVFTPSKQQLLNHLPTGDRKAAADLITSFAKITADQRIIQRAAAWVRVQAAQAAAALVHRYAMFIQRLTVQRQSRAASIRPQMDGQIQQIHQNQQQTGIRQ